MCATSPLGSRENGLMSLLQQYHEDSYLLRDCADHPSPPSFSARSSSDVNTLFTRKSASAMSMTTKASETDQSILDFKFPNTLRTDQCLNLESCSTPGSCPSLADTNSQVKESLPGPSNRRGLVTRFYRRIRNMSKPNKGKTVKEAETPSQSAATTTPSSVNGSNLIHSMSLVSPPFTPTGSKINLAGPQSVTNPAIKKLDTPLRQQIKEELQELPQVFCESRARIPTTMSNEMFLHVYRNNVDNKEHLAIVFGADIYSKSLFSPRKGETEMDRMIRGAYTGKLTPGRGRVSMQHSATVESPVACEPAAPASLAETPNDGKDILVRIHSECYTGETAWSARCDCGEQLDEAARLMGTEGRGVIVYLRQEGRGIGLGEKLKAYNLQDLGANTVEANLMLRHPADARSFGIATAILCDLGLHHIRLLTNNPNKIAAVEGLNQEISVTERVPMVPLSWQNKGGIKSEEIEKYLATKVEFMGHLLDLNGHGV